jgi:hypothetical protein
MLLGDEIIGSVFVLQKCGLIAEANGAETGAAARQSEGAACRV